MIWRDYHNTTKHTPESLRQSQHTLDWANMPDPFRHYEGVPVLDLPADPASPLVPALELLGGIQGSSEASDGAGFLSQLLYYSAAISASKRVAATGHRYALRVNPSSGNLHPTEFHCWTRGLRQWPDGLYHYRPSSHMMEQRALGRCDLPAGEASPLLFVLTSIVWREAWKYQERAYRYCLHDMGHAWQALALAAEAMGCSATAIGHFADDSISQICGLPEDEWPMLLVQVSGAPVPTGKPDGHREVWHGGTPNRLSNEIRTYPELGRMHVATKQQIGEPGSFGELDRMPGGKGVLVLPSPAVSTQPFGSVARSRRSALDFEGGSRTMSLAQLSALLSSALRPVSADFARRTVVQLYLYVHRVEDLISGVYRYWPQENQLELIKAGDQRVIAAGLSLRQDLAGNACVAFSLVAGLNQATAAYGTRGYRYAHFEAGAIGQRLYIVAEALGLGATGIGAFFDDEVNNYLHLTALQGQAIYHFAVGYPVPDPRLNA